MKLWTTLSPTNEDKRWQLLSRYLTDAGVANEFVPWSGPNEAVQDLSLLSGFDHVRISSRFGPQILQHIKVQPSWITLLGVVDGMVKRDSAKGPAWWPHCALYESFGRLLLNWPFRRLLINWQFRRLLINWHFGRLLINWHIQRLIIN